MSAPLVSAFYDFNDVIQQGKQRPNSLDLRQRFDRKPTTNVILSRCHSTDSVVATNLTLHANSKEGPPNSNFYPMPPSPKEQLFGNLSPGMIRDRAQSEDLEAQHRKRGSTNSSRYKTELCRPYEENGTCKYGDKCQFAHGFHELRGLNRHPKYKTEFCRTYHTIGFCPYGPRCHFIHNDEEKRLAGTERSNSITGSLDSSPTSPIIDIPPSPFGNCLTPPTSPGYGGEVFLFEDSHVNPTPLAVCGADLSSPNFAPENLMPILEAGSYINEISTMSPGMVHSDIGIPVTAMLFEHQSQSIAIPLRPSLEERGAFSAASSLSSESSYPPSPTDSVDGRRMQRLPVFDFIN